MFSNELKSYTEKYYALRLQELGSLREEVERCVRACDGEEALLLKFLLATLPLSDLGNYNPALFRAFVRHGLSLRENVPWCKSLPEHLFLHYVLYPRVNNEELSDCRRFFFDRLYPRVEGRSITGAVLETNYWCMEHVTYRSTDSKTNSALAIYHCGYGRCGEESTFTVSALRAVGIAARQVYAPRWSHCDDNHAWVEIWDGEGWHFLGACEPEPILDKGWFTNASSRAMLIHCRTFARGTQEELAFLYPELGNGEFQQTHGVMVENITARYAKTARVAVQVLDNGSPCPGVPVRFEILNMAELTPVAVIPADEAGVARVTLGLGCVHVAAERHGKWAEAVLDVAQAQSLTLELQAGVHAKQVGVHGEPGWADFDFDAPLDYPMYPAVLTEEQKKERNARMEQANAIRQDTPHHPVSPLGNSIQSRLLSTLTEKDRAWRVDAAVMEDALSAEKWEQNFPQDLYSFSLLSPRIYFEVLRPWRAVINARFTPEQRNAFAAEPPRAWQWIEENIAENDSYRELYETPPAALRLGSASPVGKRILFVAICRCVGVPARLNAADLVPEYWENGAFQKLFAESCSAGLEIELPGEAAGRAVYGQTWTLGRRTEDGVDTLRLEEACAGNGQSVSLRLPAGEYRLLTVNRMPNGNLFAKRKWLELKAGETGKTGLSFREAKVSDMLEKCALPAFSLRNAGGEPVESGALLDSPLNLLFWLDVGKEPTEHILNELSENGGEFGAFPCKFCFILSGERDKEDKTLQKALAVLPEVTFCYDDFGDNVNTLARRMYVDPEKLPLILFADGENNGVYACSGYNVGTAELLLRIARELI